MVNDKLNLENPEEIYAFLLTVKSDLESYNVAKPQIDKIINSKIVVDKEILGIKNCLFFKSLIWSQSRDKSSQCSDSQ